MARHERLREQGRRPSVELRLITIRTQQRSIEEQEPAQQHEKHRADEAREQAEAYPRTHVPPDRLTPVYRPTNVCHTYV
jgi:hypothetical protein